MAEFERMKEILEQTGLYTVGESSLIYAELQAYAAGLDKYFEALDELAREGFAATAQTYGLRYWERIIHRMAPTGVLEKRRKALINAMSITAGDYNLSGMQKVLDSFQAEGSLTFSDDEMKVTFNCTSSMTEYQKTLMQEQMKKFMPCWVSFEIVL